MHVCRDEDCYFFKVRDVDSAGYVKERRTLAICTASRLLLNGSVRIQHRLHELNVERHLVGNNTFSVLVHKLLVLQKCFVLNELLVINLELWRFDHAFNELVNQCLCEVGGLDVYDAFRLRWIREINLRLELRGNVVRQVRFTVSDSGGYERLILAEFIDRIHEPVHILVIKILEGEEAEFPVGYEDHVVQLEDVGNGLR